MTIHNFGISNESPSMAECTIEMHAKRYSSKSNFILCFVSHFVSFLRPRSVLIESNCNKYWVWWLRSTKWCMQRQYCERGSHQEMFPYYPDVILFNRFFFHFMLYLMQQHQQNSPINALTSRIRFYQSHNCRISSSCLCNQWTFR